jgi:RNA polymerase sigma-70 factor (ECF subfamily)
MDRLERLKAGDELAWNEVYRELWPVALSVASRYNHSLNGMEEDIAIAAIHQLQLRIQEAKEDSELRPWVATIAQGKAVDEIRRRKGLKRGEGKEVSLEELLENGGATLLPADSSEPVGEASDLLELIALALKRLRPKHREVLHDFYFDELSYSEIAAKRGLPEGTVGGYLSSGRREIEATVQKIIKSSTQINA